MSDEDAPDVSDNFYRRMFRDLNKVNVRDAAKAITLTRKSDEKEIDDSEEMGQLHSYSGVETVTRAVRFG